MDLHTELQTLISTDTGRNDVGDTSANKGQCVGLVESWIDVFGYPHIWGNAKDLLSNADPNFYEIILNTPDNFPQEGDIVVWDETWGGGDGHTAIALAGADANQFSSFEQNDHAPSDPSGLCEIIKHDYAGNHVKGWIRFKNLKVNAPINYHGLDPANAESTQIVYDTWWDKANGKLIDVAKYEQLQKEFDDYKQQYPAASPSPSQDQANYNGMRTMGYTTIEDVNKKLQSKEDEITKLTKDQIVLEQKNKKLSDTLSLDSQNNFTAMQKGIDSQDKIKELESNLQEIAKTAEAENPKMQNILTKLYQWKDLGQRFLAQLDKEDAQKQEQQIAEQAIKEMKNPQVKTDVNWLMNMFNFKEVSK